MEIKILAFGIARDIFGQSSITLEVSDNINADDLKGILNDKYPALKELRSYMIAVNEAYADEQTDINVGDEIAVIPPVSGG